MSRNNHDDLREEYAAPVERAPAAGDCSADEQIWAASRGELSGERAETMLEHARKCPACAESWKMARALGSEMAAAAARPSTATLRRSWVGLAAAAVIVLALAWIATRFTFRPPVPVDEFRDLSGPGLRSEIDEAVPLPRERFVLRWSGGAEGTVYTLEVANEQLDVLHRAVEITATEYRVPPESLADVEAGATLLWRIDAVLPDASRVSSAVFRAVLE